MTREEAKNWLNKLYIGADITDEYGDIVDMQPYSEAVDIAIKALEIAPKKGRWKDLGYNEEWYGRCYTCSVCNAEMVGAENYCPNCGSYMKEEKENGNN